MLEHHYEDIPGWFDYQDVFRNAVDNAKPRDLFVEIGAFLGRSTAFLAVEVANSGKDIHIDVIDTWKGSKFVFRTFRRQELISVKSGQPCRMW